MGMKYVDRIIRICLLVAVATSIFLSWKIWTNSSSRHTRESQTKVEVTIPKKSATEVFLPTKLITHKPDTSWFIRSENTISRIMKNFKSMELSMMTMDNQLTRSGYWQLARSKQVTELSYPSPLSMSQWSDVYGVNLNDFKGNFSFDQILISYDEKEIYFVNSRNEKMIQTKVIGDLKKIEKLVKTSEEGYKVPISPPDDEFQQVQHYQEAMILKEYSYILSVQPFSVFTQAFFSDPDVRADDDSADVSYSSENGDRLVIDNMSGNIQFEGKFHHFPDQSGDGIFSKSFQYLSRTGTAFGNVRYVHSNAHKVSYRNYVEGFPVFGENNKGRIEVNFLNGNEVMILANTETIQVPVPSEKKVTLPNTQTIVTELTNLGYESSKIKDLEIGYTWKENSENSQVVDLVPEWYVLYDQHWMSINDLYKSRPEKEAE